MVLLNYCSILLLIKLILFDLHSLIVMTSMTLITAISNSKLKHLRLYGSFNLTIAKSLAKLLTKTNISLEDVTVGDSMIIRFSSFDDIAFGTIDCDAAKVLVEAMAHSSGQNTPLLKVCMGGKCNAFLADISFPKDKVVNICDD